MLRIKLHIKALPLLFVFWFIGISNSFGQVIMMSSNPLNKEEVLLYNSYQYYTNSVEYDWKTEEWNDIEKNLQQPYHKTLPMIGYGVTDQLAMYAQFPVSYFIHPEENSFYIDDILLMSRYAIIPSSGAKSGLSLVGAVRFPTAKTGDNKNFSDGSLDFFIGEIYSTKWYSNWRTHIKSNYIINTKNEKEEKKGDEINFCIKQDYRWNKFKIAFINQYYLQFNKLDRDKNKVDDSQKTRITHQILIEYKLNNGLIIKPKFQMPSYAVGGNLYKHKIILELIYRFS